MSLTASQRALLYLYEDSENRHYQGGPLFDDDGKRLA